MSGHLMIEVLRAENLQPKDSWPFSSDPYVVVEFSSGANQCEYQTEYRSNTLNPSFCAKFQFKANIAEHDFVRKVQSVADALAGGHPAKVRVTYTRSIRKVQGLNPGENWDARPLLRKVQEAVEERAPGAKLQGTSIAGVRAEMTFLLPRKK